jgi:hypothetical protein
VVGPPFHRISPPRLREARLYAMRSGFLLRKSPDRRVPGLRSPQKGNLETGRGRDAIPNGLRDANDAPAKPLGVSAGYNNDGGGCQDIFQRLWEVRLDAGRGRGILSDGMLRPLGVQVALPPSSRSVLATHSNMATPVPWFPTY